jgi:hypothetical protein
VTDGGLALQAWLAARCPGVPEAFVERLAPESSPGSARAAPHALIGPALRDALARRGERGGAFRLLAADAWITWAAEAALDAPDPEAALLEILDEVLRAAEER